MEAKIANTYTYPYVTCCPPVYATVLDQAGIPAQIPPVDVEVGEVVVEVYVDVNIDIIVVVVVVGGGLPDTGQDKDLTVVIQEDPA
jgi:hypothetical protein